MAAPITHIAEGGAKSASPFPYPFDTLQAGFIVNVSQRQGLHEVLGQAPDKRWILRALNDRAWPLVHAAPDEIVGFELPIFACYASRNRSLIVALVDGDEYHVTREDVPEVEEPLFQECHPEGLIAFIELAVEAGFSRFELTNGLHAWEGTPQDMIDQCRRAKTMD